MHKELEILNPKFDFGRATYLAKRNCNKCYGKGYLEINPHQAVNIRHKDVILLCFCDKSGCSLSRVLKGDG